ncbi:hypothetical protein C9F11_01725 [Streptomyces sp. YIM 121038]|uniref:FG-GAP repeat domain-containing protein n=1 Tax=Streptomyces sp. YIM 121038 TaxID=2136401 RepID=UPI001110647D|nr:VCBS repeat-containing protein [Streptomyces sp. YIM 121038]QCX74048.1 hypothetical protein C9F11_01725 [Streptomyces sp. YIM 121038]
MSTATPGTSADLVPRTRNVEVSAADWVYLRDTIKVNSALLQEIRADRPAPGTRLVLIAREITHDPGYVLPLTGYPVLLVAETYRGNGGGVDTTGPVGAAGAVGSAGGTGGGSGGRDGKAGGPGGNGAPGGAATPITLLAARAWDVRLIARGGTGGPGGTGGQGGQGKDGTKPPKPGEDGRDPGYGGPGGRGGNGAVGGPGAQIRVETVEGSGVLGDGKGGDAGPAGPGGGGGAGGGGYNGPGEPGRDGTAGQPGPAAGPSVAAEFRTHTADAWWAMVRGELGAAYTEAWAEYRTRVGEYLFRCYAPGLAERNDNRITAGHEFTQALVLRPGHARAVELSQYLATNLTPLGVPYDVDVVPNFPAQEQFVTAYGDLVVGVYTAATDLLLFAKGEAQKIQLVESDLGHFNDMKTVLDTERRAAKAGVDAAKGRADILDKQLREVQAQLDAVRAKLVSERLEFPPGNDLGAVIGAAIVIAAAVSALYTGGATIAAMLAAGDMIAKSAASMEGFDTVTGKYRDGSYLVNWFDWTADGPKPRPGVDIKTSKLTDLGDQAAKFIDASGTLVQLFQAKVDGKLENEEKNLLARQVELVRERALQMLEITHQQLNLAAADAKIAVNTNDIARLTNLEAGWQRDITQLTDICRRMVTRNQHYMDLLTEYCYYANRTVDLWTFSSHTPVFTFDYGFLHPDDIENAYHPLARGDDSRVNGLLEKYQNSKRQLFALMDRRKEYDSYGLDQDVLYLRVTTPEVLNALRTNGTATFTVPLDAFVDRFEMKTAYLHVGLLGATSANPRMTVLVEHPGTATNRYRDGSPRTAAAGPRTSTVQATFDKSDPGRPMTDQAFYGRSPATTWRLTIERSTAQEAQLDLAGLSAVHVTLWYWHFRRKSSGPAPAPMTVWADFDGDGVLDETVWEPARGLWRVRRTSGGEALTETWGQAGDVPVPADYDGDGKAELAVFDPSSGKLFTRPLLGGRVTAYHWATADHVLTAEEQTGAERLIAALEVCARRLSDTQRAAEAVEPQQAACRLLRRLARLDARHLPKTIEALVLLTHYLAAAGRWEESVTTGEEAIALARKLAADHPQDDALVHRAAETVIGIAGLWWQRSELQARAADLALQGTLTAGVLAAKNPAHRPRFAAWATSPTTPFLVHVGRMDEAYLLGTQAITLYRTLAAEKPDDDELAYRISWSSIDVALHLWSEPELQAKATDITVSAIDNLRILCRRTSAYRRQFAQWAASPAAAFLAQSGRWDEAVAVGDESISLYRVLIAENPGDEELSYRLSWASIDVALHLWGKPELQAKATDLTVTAIDNLRILSTRNPSYRPQLADWIMSPTTSFLLGTGQKQRAIDLVREAVDLYTQLNTQDPVTYGPKLANAKKTLEQLQS